MEKKNPYLEPHNYMQGYQESFNEFFNSKDRVDIERLAHEVLSRTEDGKKLLKLFETKVSNPTPSQLSQHFDTACVYYEGYRAAFRYIIQLVKSYQARKDFEAKQAELTKQGTTE